MPKLECRCGYVHNLSPIPDHGWHAIPDAELEELLGDDDPEVRDATFLRAARGFYECPHCGRIAWEREGEGRYSFYKPEVEPRPSGSGDQGGPESDS